MFEPMESPLLPTKMVDNNGPKYNDFKTFLDHLLTCYPLDRTITLTPCLASEDSQVFVKVIHASPPRVGKTRLTTYTQQLMPAASGFTTELSLKKLAKLVYKANSQPTEPFEEAREGVAGR